MSDLSKVRDREALKPQREPHWQAVGIGQHVGYRPSTVGGIGTWIARYFDTDSRKRQFRSLGDYGHLQPKDRYAAACNDAREWFGHLSGGGSKKVITVRVACERYAEGRPDAQWRFARCVYADPIAKVELPKLTPEHVRAWRKRIETRPAIVSRQGVGMGRGKGKVTKTRERSPGTVNRDMVPLRAALNMALDHGDVLNDRAWRVELRPIKKADGRRNIYLDKAQRRALLDHLPDDVAALCRGLCLLPLRPGALAALRVGDYDPRRKELTVGKDKAGDGRRLLVQGATAALLAEQSKGKLPGAPLFARWDGSQWASYMWKDAIKAAVKAAGLPDDVVAYTLRHSTITDLVQSGLDLLTVAQVSGTSVAMIEKHYGHLRGNRAAEALAGLAL